MLARLDAPAPLLLPPRPAGWPAPLRWDGVAGAAVMVVLAAEGYPRAPGTGDKIIDGLERTPTPGRRGVRAARGHRAGSTKVRW